MALLNEIAVSGFTGTAPTPVEQVAINKYFVNNELFNLMQFVNIGMGSNIGNLQATIVTYNAPDSAEFRKIGNEYNVSNNVPKTVTVVMKMLGGEFQTDRVFARAFSGNENALDNWTEQQIAQKINSIINGFCKYFIQGNSTTNVDAFDGLEVYFSKHAGQVKDTAHKVVGGLTPNNALEVENFLYELIAMVPDANVIITDRLQGKPFLQAVESNRGRGHSKLTVNDKQYNEAVGLPVVGLSSDCFSSTMLAKGIPFIVGKIAETDGIRVAVPMNPGVGSQGAILDIVRPRVGNTDAGEAVFVRKGGVEMVCVPILEDPFCAAVGYIKKVAEAAG